MLLSQVGQNVVVIRVLDARALLVCLSVCQSVSLWVLSILKAIGHGFFLKAMDELVIDFSLMGHL